MPPRGDSKPLWFDTIELRERSRTGGLLRGYIKIFCQDFVPIANPADDRLKYFLRRRFRRESVANLEFRLQSFDDWFCLPGNVSAIILHREDDQQDRHGQSRILLLAPDRGPRNWSAAFGVGRGFAVPFTLTPNVFWTWLSPEWILAIWSTPDRPSMSKTSTSGCPVK